MGKVLFYFSLIWISFIYIFFNVPLGALHPLFDLLVFLVCILFFLFAGSTFLTQIQPLLVQYTSRKVGYILLGNMVIFLLVIIYGEKTDGRVMLARDALHSVNLMIFASIFGVYLSSAVKRTAELVPVCLTACAADVISVLKGPTSAMVKDITVYYEGGMQGAPPFIDYLLVKVAVPGMIITQPAFGVTDWILISLISSSLFRLKIDDNVFSWIIQQDSYISFSTGALALFLGVVITQVLNMFLPAMVFISVMYLLVLLIGKKVYREIQRKDLVYSVVFPLLIIMTILLTSH